MKQTTVLCNKKTHKKVELLMGKAQPEPCTYIYYSRPGQMIDKYIIAWFLGKGKFYGRINKRNYPGTTRNTSF